MDIILAADIGGTNCRLGLFKLMKNKLVMDKAAWVETGSIAHADTLMNAFERELDFEPAKASAVSVAIAGPVDDCCKGRLSNGTLELDFTELNVGEKRYFLLNDFMGQAYAVLSPEGEKARLITGPKNGSISGVKAVIGAGTGLGQALLVPLDGSSKAKASHWVAVASENGHSAFPFVNGAENDFHTFLRTKLRIPYATGDETVTGRGLSALHEFLTGEKLTPAQVGAKALGKDTPTLKWFSRFYARACRNWMLSTMCEGGLWIAGGIAAQNPMVINGAYFIEELYNSPYHSKTWDDYLHSVPVFLLEDTNSGLWGAARFAQQELETQASILSEIGEEEKDVEEAASENA